MLDGGLATALERRGHDLRDALWSARLLLDDPAAILGVHRAYLDAGADCIISSAYQATLPGLQRHGATREEAVAALRRSTELAREAVGRGEIDDRAPGEPTATGGRGRGSGACEALQPLVAASVGPYGAWLADGSEYDGRYGRTVRELADFHRERLRLLAPGADLLACETIPSALEAEAILVLLDELPDPWAWFSFTCADGRVIRDGTPIEEVTEVCAAHPRVAAVGVNCTEPRFVGDLASRIRTRTELPIVVYPNSGELYDGRTKTWSAGAGAVGWLEGLHEAWHAGARIVGGCCRTGPEEIRELRTRLERGDFPA